MSLAYILSLVTTLVLALIMLPGCWSTDSNYHWVNDTNGGHGTTSWEIR